RNWEKGGLVLHQEGVDHRVLGIALGTFVKSTPAGYKPEPRVLKVPVYLLGGEVILVELLQGRHLEFGRPAVLALYIDYVAPLDLAQAPEDRRAFIGVHMADYYGRTY